MKNHTIIILGTRGIPNILGGIETHCEELYPRIKKNSSYKIIILRRKSYIASDNKNNIYKNIILKDIYTPKSKSFEAIIHTFLGILYARYINANCIHIHGIGPGLLTPFAKLLRLKVIHTNHGPDYDRNKWGLLAKYILKLGEKLSFKYSDRSIVISEVIKQHLEKQYGEKDLKLIYNGVNIPKKSNNVSYLNELGLKKNKYIFSLGRFVEEKGFHDLIEAYRKINHKEFKLVIAGDADHETNYSKSLKKTARKYDIVLTGFIKGNKLNDLFSHTCLFVMPSYHEGLPIALLEALSYNANILVSDIPANKEINLNDKNYFKVGCIESLKKGLEISLKKENKNNFENLIREKYNWDMIANQTKKLYDNIFDL